MPGVLILEGMAQLSGLLLEASLQQKYAKSAKAVLTVLERTKFRSLVKPGDTLAYRVEVVSINEAGGKIKASALRGGSLVTSTEMVFGFKYVDDPQLDEKRRKLMEIWLGAASLAASPQKPQNAGEGAGAPSRRPAGRDAGAPSA